MLSLDVTIPQDIGEKKNRLYFLWRYKKQLEVVIEIVSNKKGGELGTRQARYAGLGVKYYVVYDPLGELGEVPLRAFELHGAAYVELVRAWFEDVGLGLAEWEGTFEGILRRWLRWCTRDGKVLPTGEERADNEKARAETAEARADSEHFAAPGGAAIGRRSRGRSDTSNKPVAAGARRFRQRYGESALRFERGTCGRRGLAASVDGRRWLPEGRGVRGGSAKGAARLSGTVDGLERQEEAAARREARVGRRGRRRDEGSCGDSAGGAARRARAAGTA